MFPSPLKFSTYAVTSPAPSPFKFPEPIDGIASSSMGEDSPPPSWLLKKQKAAAGFGSVTSPTARTAQTASLTFGSSSSTSSSRPALRFPPSLSPSSSSDKHFPQTVGTLSRYLVVKDTKKVVKRTVSTLVTLENLNIAPRSRSKPKASAVGRRGTTVNGGSLPGQGSQQAQSHRKHSSHRGRPDANRSPGASRKGKRKEDCQRGTFLSRSMEGSLVGSLSGSGAGSRAGTGAKTGARGGGGGATGGVTGGGGEGGVEWSPAKILSGILGVRNHAIFGSQEADIIEPAMDDSSSESSAEPDDDHGPVILRDGGGYKAVDMKRLSESLINDHQNFMLGKRSAFIEANLVSETEPFDRAPRFNFPFSPVIGTTYGIRSDKGSDDDDDGDGLFSVHSDNLPGEDESDPRSRPGSPSFSRPSRLSGGRSTAKNSLNSSSDSERTGDPPASRESRGSITIKRFDRSQRNSLKTEHMSSMSRSEIGNIRRDSEGEEVFFTRKEKETYFGPRARKDFYHKYKQVKDQALTIPDRSKLAKIGRSPRSEYLAYLNDKTVVPSWPHPDTPGTNVTLPWPILQRSLQAPRVIDLSGMGLGDAVVLGLVAVFETLPQIDTLLLADNRLSDETFTPLFQEITHMHNLTHLDISFNDMDESSKIILEYLSTESCNLKVLNMEHADIDDFECGDLMTALQVNSSLLTLDLRDNLIGEKEQLNVVMPEFDTGGEMIAEMLSVNTTLTELDVSWNSIRGDSALQVAQSLEANGTIKILILSHNAFGDEPSQKLGDVLAHHPSLKHVDLSYNGVSPRAAMVLANAFRTNETLDLLQLNGNTIGKRGAESLLQALRRSHRVDSGLVIEINNCDCELEDRSLFDPVEPTNKYELKMNLPYSRMVGNELLRMANTRPGAFFLSVKYRPPNGTEAAFLTLTQGDGENKVRSKEMEDLWKVPINKIVEELSDGVIDFPDLLNADIRELLGLFQLWPSIDTVDKIMYSLDLSSISEESILDTIFRSVFHIVDIDNSQQVDRKEMKLAMVLFAIKITDEEIDRIISEYDIDKSGEIEEDEFVSWMINKYCKQKQADKQPVKLKGSNWEIPQEGVLTIDFRADRMPPTAAEIGSDEGVKRLLHNIQHADTDAEKAKLFDMATANSDIYLTSAQAQELMASTAKGDEVSAIKKLLPQLSDPQQCCQLVNNNLTLRQALLLRKQLGPAFGVILGNATGRYVLDLEKDGHRVAARKIAELNNYEKRFSRTKSGRGDTSQKGNFENFRNENLNQEQQKLDSNWFVKIPKFGKLRFDYVSTTKSSKAAKCLSKKRFGKLLEALKLDEVDVLRVWYNEWTARDESKREQEIAERAKFEEEYEKERLTKEFKEARLRGAVVQNNDVAKIDRMIQRKAADSIKSSPAVDALTRSARSLGFHTEGAEDSVQGRLGNRRAGIDASAHSSARLLQLQMPGGLAEEDDEDDEVDGDDEDDDEMDESADGHYDASSALLKFTAPFKAPDFIGWIEATAHWRDYQQSDHKRYSYHGTEQARENDKALGELKRQEELKLKNEVGQMKPLKPYLHLYYKLQELQVAACSINLTVRQAIEIIDHFPRQEHARVQAIVALHRTLLDLENFQLILRIVDDSEAKEVVHRLGWLNVFNPVKPEHFFRLDLRYKDHQRMAEMLSILAIEEPGDNWLDEEYRWSSYDDPVVGWVLPKSWTGREDDTDNAGNCGPKDFGRLDLEYTSDTSLDCNPVWTVRKELQNRVLLGTKLIY